MFTDVRIDWISSSGSKTEVESLNQVESRIENKDCASMFQVATAILQAMSSWLLVMKALIRCGTCTKMVKLSTKRGTCALMLLIIVVAMVSMLESLGVISSVINSSTSMID